MNKMIKGSIAGATGVAVLMGGFGTYALWSDSADLPASGVTSGEMYIAPVDPSDVVWADANGGEWETGDLIVPGDEVTRTQTFDVRGTGSNLAGTINFSMGSVDYGDFDHLTVDVDVTASNGTEIVETAPGSNNFTFDDPFGDETLTAVVTYTFDGDSGTGATGVEDQDATAELGLSTFTITQTN